MPKSYVCDQTNGSWDAGHSYEYVRARWSGEPLRICSVCGRTEAYYCDDLQTEIEMGVHDE